MNILIFRTNIETRNDFAAVISALKRKFSIKDLTIDLDDPDKVLRVITEINHPIQIAAEVKKLDYFCEELED